MSKDAENIEALRSRAKALRLWGLLDHWPLELAISIVSLLEWEESARIERSIQRRVGAAKLGHFKTLADFDWKWPTSIDQSKIADLMTLEFLADASNIVFIGTNGVGKTTLALNIAQSALMAGHTVLYKTAGNLLGELAAIEGDTELRRRLNHYAGTDLLFIDEIGYLSYTSRHADLLFELISRRYEKSSTIVTTNKPFSQWSEVFPKASCVQSLVDRLVHHSEIVAIEGKSYRLKEANERAQRRAQQSKTTRKVAANKADHING